MREFTSIECLKEEIAKYARRGELAALLRHLGQYEQEVQSSVAVPVCDNLAANSILSIYVQKARQQGIEVRLVNVLPKTKNGIGVSGILYNAQIWRRACLSHGGRVCSPANCNCLLR